MKNKRSSKQLQQGGDGEKEKNTFEKFEDEVKSTVFNVLYVLLKDDDNSKWKHIIVVLTDFIQIWQFSFAEGFDFPWKGGDALTYLQTFLNFFQVRYWMGKLDYVAYIVVFYILIFIIFLVILDIFYVSYSFTKKKFTFVWPLQALRSVAALIITTLFLPFLDSFSSAILCSSKPIHIENSPVPTPEAQAYTTHQYMELHPEVQCWEGQHIIHATIGLIVSFIFIIICLGVSLTFYDNKISSQDISARIDSRSDIFVIILKIIMTYVYLFFPGHTYHWFQIILLFVLALTAYTNFRNKWPYYNDKMNKYLCIMTGILLWANFLLIIVKLFEHTEFNGGLQIYFLGLPLVIGIVLFEGDKRVEILCKNINNFQRGEDVTIQVRYFLQLVLARDSDKKSDLLLKGYVFQHEDQCMYQDCNLKLYKNSIQQNKRGSNSLKKHIMKAQNSDQHQLLLQHAQFMYKQGLLKFPNCTSLKIQYAFFLMDHLHKKEEAIAQLISAELDDPPFDEKFLIFRYKKNYEDYGGVNQSEGHHGGLDVVSKFAYESSLKQCQQHIIRSAELHLKFWNHLIDERPDIAKLDECGAKINKSVQTVEHYWNQLQKLNPNGLKALRLYAKFLIEILNDKESGQELLARSKDAANVKQNFYDNNNLQEDLNDINAISQNGTPCIYVSGEPKRIGMIQNCNSGASRIFGYTSNEMRNHNVEKLMPEMYGKNHSKILDEALAKGAENIPNKERLVFARHKSGYIFPVWLQLKMAAGTTNGIQFVALFKIDKKLITSDIAYIIINKEKKLQGLSSSCMSIMNLDISKMRKLTQSGINITRLAPQLFKDNQLDPAYQTKQGSLLEWYLPEFNSKRSDKDSSKSSSVIEDKKEDTMNRSIVISTTKTTYKCHISPISMGYLGEIGWYMKLDSALQHKSMNGNNRNNLQQVKQPLFQFRFDDKSGKFIREIRDVSKVDNCGKDPNFVNGLWQHEITTQEVQSQADPEDSQEDESKKTSMAPHPIIEAVHINESPDLDFNEKKKLWRLKVETYRLQDGKFVLANYDDELKKQLALEAQKRRKDEEEKEIDTMDGLKNNLKSRKALQAAINSKSVPGAITNLKITMALLVVFLLGLAITEFAVVNNQFTSINENFKLIYLAQNRIAEIQRIAYNTRTLVLINEHKLTNTQLYSTETDFVSYLKNDMDQALDSLYLIQNNMTLSTLSVTPEHQLLLENKTVNLYFLDSQQNLKILAFSLRDAVLQIASAVFSVKQFSLDQFTNTQQDVFFIMKNSFNDFLIAMRKSANNYVQEMYVRTQERNQFISILFYCSISIIILALIILCPVVGKVNLARMKILSLFVDIPNYHVTALATKCEDFIAKCQEEDQNDEIEMEDQTFKADDSDLSKQVSKKRQGAKHPRNLVSTNSKIFIEFLCGAIIVIGYFVAMFEISTTFIDHIKIISSEMNVVSQAEPYYGLVHNVHREIIYDPTNQVLGYSSDTIARDTLQQLYGLNEQIILNHNDHAKILPDDYLQSFKDIYKGNICEENIVKMTLVPHDCSTYLGGTATHGLQSILVKYFESLREELSVYYRNKEAGQNLMPLLNSEFFADFYVIQSRFLADSFRKLVSVLSESVETDFLNKIDIRIAVFVVFVICLVLSYLIIWLPFISKLNREIWRTKAMLTIIPIEVILKIPRIQQFLMQQTYFAKRLRTQ